MKKITTLILLLFCTLVGYSQIIGTGFEAGWDSGAWPIRHEGTGSSRWREVNNNLLANNGSVCMSVTPSTGTPTAPVKDWLITPVINLSGVNNPKISFYGKFQGNTPGNSRLEVMVSTTDTNFNSFVSIETYADNLSGTNPLNSVLDQYAHKEISLLPYVGSNVYIAFVVVNEGRGRTWFLDDVYVNNYCGEATNLGINNITSTSATATWSNPLNVANFEIDVMLASDMSTTHTADYTSISGTSQLLSNLIPNTQYKYFIRSVCGTSFFSEWIGPFTFTTLVPSSPLPYSENFENSVGWQFSNGTQLNKWYIGTAAHNGGTKSLYVSNNNGVDNTYTISTASVTQAYKEITIPADATQLDISFDWRAVGEGTTTRYDYFRVWLVPTTYNPVAGTQISIANSQGIQIGGDFNQQSAWVNYSTLLNLPAGVAGTNRKIVFEWRNDSSGGTQPPAAIDNLNIKVLKCLPPTNLVLGTVTQNTAVVSWTAPATFIPSTYEYFVTQTNQRPSDTATPTGTVVSGNSVTLTGLEPGRVYYVWIRGNCGSASGVSSFSIPLIINTAQIPATLPYTESFDGPGFEFGFLNGSQPNKWIVGSDTFLSPNKSLYISNNDQNNTYTINTNSTTFAYREIAIGAGITQLQVSFDWKAVGQGDNDRMRVWLVSNSSNIVPGSAISSAAQRIQIGGNYSGRNSWTSVNNTVTIPAALAGTTVKLVFEWVNDSSSGTQPPAAVDNIKVKEITCSAPTNLVLNSVTADTAVISWTVPTTFVPGSYDYFVTQSNLPPANNAVPSGNVTGNTATLTGLQQNQTYYVWVRGNCGAVNGNSYLLGPLSFSTPQVPATLPYQESFDTPGFIFSFNNGTQVNKWMVGSDTFLSPNNSLYISNDNSLNTYTINQTSVTQAYRDFHVNAGAGEMEISFSWKAVGERIGTSNYDYFRVWLVPVSFTPIPGTQITALAGERIKIGNEFNAQADWMVYTDYVDVSAFAGQNMRLVFEWRNDGGGGSQPPAAIDNLKLTLMPCSPPTGLILTAVDQSSATLSWTAPLNNVPSSYDYFVSQTNTPPTNTATPTGSVTGNTVTIDQLQPNQTYYFWVRGNCGTSNTRWIGPLVIRTTQIPAELNFFDGFEGDSGFTLSNNPDLPNKWIIGNAVSASGERSLYISNDGSAFQYTTSTSLTVVHAYRDIIIPAGTTTDIVVSFDWRNQGERNFDYMRAWIVPVTYNPTVGTQITQVAGHTQLGGNYQLSNTWSNQLFTFPGSTFAGQTIRLVFEWRNDGGGGAQSPAAVDNVEVKALTCATPIDLTAAHAPNGGIRLSWTPVGTETQWEVVVQPQNSGSPGNAPTTSVFVSGSPNYTFPGADGQLYEFYVRAICSETDKSFWAGPFNFSVFRPDACADLDISPLDLNVNANGEYIVCDAQSVTVELDANYNANAFKSTVSYDVEQIPYNPPFPFRGGIEMNVNVDDTWAPPFTLPFDVCFYGNEFSSVQVSSNGFIRFGSNITNGAPWSIPAGVQFPDPTYDAISGYRLRNGIMGVYQDIDPVPTKSPNASINYQVLGLYPCRALVVNYSEVKLYGTECVRDLPTQNYQIVIYEITNIIEVYVANRQSCSTHNGGRGAIGLINADGTQATIPPGRNVGTWTTQNEAWRFKPSGEVTPIFGWYQDGVLISDNPQHTVELTDSAKFEAVITYPGCGAEDIVLRKGFDIKISEEIILPQADEIVICLENLDDSERGRISDNDEIILSNLGNPANFSMSYYHSLADAEAGINKIPNPDTYLPSAYPEVIYVRVENNDTGCFGTTSFNVREGVLPEFNVNDQMSCTNYAFPQLLPNQKYVMYEELDPVNQSIVTNTVVDPKQGDILDLGFYKVYVEVESVDKCTEVFSYKVFVIPCSIQKGISPNADGLNDYFDLTYYMVQDIKIFNRYGKVVYSHGPGYTNQWMGQSNSGGELPSGTYFYNIVTPFENFTGWIQLVREQ